MKGAPVLGRAPFRLAHLSYLCTFTRASFRDVQKNKLIWCQKPDLSRHTWRVCALKREAQSGQCKKVRLSERCAEQTFIGKRGNVSVMLIDYELSEGPSSSIFVMGLMAWCGFIQRLALCILNHAPTWWQCFIGQHLFWMTTRNRMRIDCEIKSAFCVFAHKNICSQTKRKEWLCGLCISLLVSMLWEWCVWERESLCVCVYACSCLKFSLSAKLV